MVVVEVVAEAVRQVSIAVAVAGVMVVVAAAGVMVVVAAAATTGPSRPSTLTC